MGVTARTSKGVGVIVLGLAAILLAAAIALVLREPAPATARVDDGPFLLFLEMSRSVGFDYESAATPAELADRVDGVFAGRIVTVRPGQSYSTVPGGEAIFATSVIEVEVTDEIAGPPGRPETVRRISRCGTRHTSAAGTTPTSGSRTTSRPSRARSRSAPRSSSSCTTSRTSWTPRW